MSLINDALRRAKSTQRHETPPEVSLALRPVNATPQRSGSALLLPTIIIVLLVVGGVLIGLALNQRDSSQVLTVNARQPAPAIAQEAAVTAAPAPQRQLLPEVKKPEPAPTPATTITAGATAASEVAPVPTEVIEPVPLKPALPVVRGISYNPTRPSAVLNTKTAFVGDKTGGFRVLAITRDSVTVENEGVTNVLTLPE